MPAAARRINHAEGPSQALRRGRKTSSMWLAIEAVKKGEADVAVSAGNTGALMAMARFCLRTLPGIDRPAIAAVWPTVRGNSVVLDLGATIGGDARHLVALAVMGSAMASVLFEKERPTVGLLNIGVEEIKGHEEIREAALLGSGRAVLLVPSTGIDEGSFETIVIAWKDSIEVARAVAAADPFLMLAKKVYLVAVGENTETAASLQQAENYLQLHFAELRSEILGPSDKSIGETLIGTCEARGRALLVMGAYSHWRWQERVFGGVTEYVLRQARTPILMAH